MTYSAWEFKDAAHLPAFAPSPPQPYRSRSPSTPPSVIRPISPQPHHLLLQQSSRRALLHGTRHPPTTSTALAASACLQLGVNRTTGRLQWCPGCPYAKIMLLLPVALMPVVLVLVLLGNLDTVGSVRHHQLQQQQWSAASVAVVSSQNNNDIDGDDEPLAVRAPALDTTESDLRRRPRCKTIRYSLSETLDTEERELLRDVRTSFIPPEYVLASPDCVEPEAEDEEVLDDVDDGGDNDDDDVVFAEMGDEQLQAELFAVVDDATAIEVDVREDQRRRREAVAVPGGDGVVAGNVTTTSRWEMLKNALVEVLEGRAQPAAATVGESGTAEQIRSAQAAVMLQYMDPTVDPCTDFYQYACGNWERLNSIPKDKGAFDTFEMLREKLDRILQALLSEPVSSDGGSGNDTSSSSSPPVSTTTVGSTVDELTIDEHQSNDVKFRRRMRRGLLSQRAKRHDQPVHPLNAEDKAKLLYQTCMQYDTLEQRGVQPLLEFLHQLGGWPALDDSWQPDRFDWLNLTATLRQYNNDILLMLWVGPDIKNSNENVIQFDQTGLGLPTRDYFLEPSNAKYLAAYEQFTRSTIEIMGADAERAQREAADIVRFETQLARITSTPESRINVSLLYNKMSLGELHEQIPQIDWLHYLSVVQARQVAANETVVMYAMDYMRALVGLLEQTDGRTVANYLLWRFVRHRINNLDDRFQAAKQRFFFVLFGREESPERWKTCVSHVNTNMGMAVGAMFVRRYFDENSKRDTLEMTHELQQAFREILNTTEWLDAPTRHFAEMKVNAMQLRIGYPDFILEREQLDAKFAGLRMEEGKYFENTLRVLRHIAHVEQTKLGEVINRTEWNTAPAIVNAYYSRNKNQILFPAGILQPPFYHRHFPRALNYGGIGVVIGHELTHGFDDKGRLFDMDGNMLRWWSDAAVEGFHKRARCLVAQYGNYTVPDVGVPLNGESTQGENIADNGGLKQAYRAYGQWLAAQPDAEAAERAERMPGVDATGRQLFFLNFAQVWCGAMRPEAAVNKLKTAVHSPGMYRVIGTLSNSEEFAQVYGCAAGTPMNPEKKCRVW